MKICHLHIGMHKTGSTSIQNFFDSNRRELIDNGVYYADMGAANHSGPLLFALCLNPEKDSEIQFIGLTDEELRSKVQFFRDKLNQSMKQEYSNIVFSAEAIVKLTIEELNLFKQYLLNFVDEIRVYCYVREPMPFIASAFQQIIKSQPITVDSQAVLPNYREKLEKFHKVFKSVNYRVFSKNRLLKGDVVNDFCQWLDLQPLSNYGNKDNESLGALAIKFLYRFQDKRQNKPISQHKLGFIEDTLSKLPFQKVALPFGDMGDIINKNLDDFRWMKRLIDEQGETFNVLPVKGFQSSFGNFYGVFTEEEKSTIIDLSKSIPSFDHFILKEVGISVSQLVNEPLSSVNPLEFYLRKVSESAIGGRANYIENSERVNLTVYLNNELAGVAKSDTYRDDLTDRAEDMRFVGFYFDFKKKLSESDIVTIIVGGDVVFSGSI